MLYDVEKEVFPDYLFSGKTLDTETGLYYYGRRYYDPRTSVWQSTDSALGAYLPQRGSDDKLIFNKQPAWRWDIPLPGRGGVYLPQNLGLYSYTWDNPLIFIDPDGLMGGQSGKGVHYTELDPISKEIIIGTVEVEFDIATLGEAEQIPVAYHALKNAKTFFNIARKAAAFSGRISGFATSITDLAKKAFNKKGPDSPAEKVGTATSYLTDIFLAVKGNAKEKIAGLEGLAKDVAGSVLKALEPKVPEPKKEEKSSSSAQEK